jgi:prefoldin subunit 5
MCVLFLVNTCESIGANYQEKIPEIEKSLALVTFLKQKKDDEENIVTRYNLADTIYSKAEVDCKSGIVNLWLGANVMLEYTHEEAIELLSSKEAIAKREFEEVGYNDVSI